MPDDRERRSSKDEAGGADADGIERKRTSAILEAIVLSILCASHVSLGAYAIARQARALGTPMAPNQIYRALDRLGPRVRRVETLNAYMEDAGTPGAIMLCRICGRIDALDVQIDTAIDRLCGAAGFQSARVIAEIVGICARCRSTEASIDREAREQPQ